MFMVTDGRYTSQISVEVLYGYLASHLDVQRLNKWISNTFPNENEQVTGVWPYNRPFPLHLVKTCTPEHIKEEIYTELTKFVSFKIV